jgi:hypothetical protein
MTGCIYHEADLDGVMSAAIVKKYFKGDIDLLPYNYGKEIPDVNKYDEEYWLVEEDVAKLMNHEPIIKGWAIIKNDPNIDSDIISSNKSNINVIEAEKNEGDERNILLHIGILSPFNDDPVIIIKQKGV